MATLLVEGTDLSTPWLGLWSLSLWLRLWLDISSLLNTVLLGWVSMSMGNMLLGIVLSSCMLWCNLHDVLLGKVHIWDDLL